MDESPSAVSDRSRSVALGLAVVGGVFGLHRFYTGHTKSGVWMCLTLGGLGVWFLYDVVLVVAGEFRDSEGRRVLRWEGTEENASEDRLERLESQVAELAERLDFAERLLSKQREQDRLPRGS